jgi:hypothetical protein
MDRAGYKYEIKYFGFRNFDFGIKKCIKERK